MKYRRFKRLDHANLEKTTDLWWKLHKCAMITVQLSLLYQQSLIEAETCPKYGYSFHSDIIDHPKTLHSVNMKASILWVQSFTFMFCQLCNSSCIEYYIKLHMYDYSITLHIMLICRSHWILLALKDIGTIGERDNRQFVRITMVIS